MKQTTDLDKPIQYYLWVIDVDSKEALDEIGKLDNIKERCIIEYHEDNMGRLHIFGLSTHQIPSKSLTDGKVRMEVFAASKHSMNHIPKHP